MRVGNRIIYFVFYTVFTALVSSTVEGEPIKGVGRNSGDMSFDIFPCHLIFLTSYIVQVINDRTK